MRSVIISGRVHSCALALALAAGTASAQQQLWIRQFGTSALDSATAIAPDAWRGAFVAGYASGSLGGAHAGGEDAWLARYDAGGTRLWILQFGTSAGERANALAPDGSGGAFVGGYTFGGLGGPNAGGSDAWLARYDAAGNRLWIRQFGTGSFDYAEDLASDGLGGVFVGGYTFGSLGGSYAGGSDAWLARYDAAGNRLWIRQFGTSTWEEVYGLAPDGLGGVFVAGWTDGNLGGPNAGGRDAWLARYDATGNQTWIRQFGTNDDERAFAIASDGSGGAFVAGHTWANLGGPNAGKSDVWLARYDAGGTRLWIIQFGTSVEESAYALAPDGSGGVFIAGDTSGNLGGPTAGGRDAWLARYDAFGTRLWIRQFGTVSLDYVEDLAPDGSWGTFVAGGTGGGLGGPNAGSTDAWLSRWTSGQVPCYANCDGSTTAPFLNAADFTCFLQRFAAGCSAP